MEFDGRPASSGILIIFLPSVCSSRRSILPRAKEEAGMNKM